MSSERNLDNITDARSGAAFAVQVITQSEATELVGVQEGGAIKVRLMATPAGADAANQELVNFLSEKLGVAPTSIEIVAGANKSKKMISVEGLTATQIEEKLGVE